MGCGNLPYGKLFSTPPNCFDVVTKTRVRRLHRHFIVKFETTEIRKNDAALLRQYEVHVRNSNTWSHKLNWCLVGTCYKICSHPSTSCTVEIIIFKAISIRLMSKGWWYIFTVYICGFYSLVMTSLDVIIQPFHRTRYLFGQQTRINVFISNIIKLQFMNPAYIDMIAYDIFEQFYLKRNLTKLDIHVYFNLLILSWGSL